MAHRPRVPKAAGLGAIASLAMMGMVALAGIGLARAADGPPPPTSCAVKINDQGNVEMTWLGGGDLLAIIRSGEIVDTVFLREEGSRWLDDQPPGGPATYGIAGRDTFTGPIGDTISCGTVDTPTTVEPPAPTTTTTTIDPGPEPVAESPSSCSVDNQGDGVIVTWSSSPSPEYAIWRNGRIVIVQNEKDGNRWVDSVRSGKTHYSVSGQLRGDVSPRTYCGFVTAPQQDAQCTAVATNPGFTVTWSGMGEGDVIISRSVDESRWYWRGRTSAPSFKDSSRPGDIRYQVAPRATRVATQCADG